MEPNEKPAKQVSKCSDQDSGDGIEKDDSNKTDKVLFVTPNVAIQGARARNNLEDHSDEQMKRQRTISGSSPVESFIFPGTSASPPKFISMEEVMKAAKGVSNMVLAHEIAVDKNFKLEKFEPAENSLEKKVKDTMHKAFWDNLTEQLQNTPPVYDQAFVLLQEVRDNLIDITLPHHTRLRQEISDKFDVDLIKQQAEHEVLDFKEYSEFVLSTMSRLCAPIRDDSIQNLKKENEVVNIFKGVMVTLDLMRLDMANYTIQQIRPHIIAQSVEYERKKFSEFLETQNDGLEISRAWLTEHIKEDDVRNDLDENAIKKIINEVMSRAYIKLLSWPDENPLPETVVLDGNRFLELRDRLTQVCIIAACLLVTLSSVTHVLPQPDVFKMTLKKNLCSILDPAFSIHQTYNLMENVAEQVVKDISDHLAEHDKPPLPSATASALKEQIIEIKNSEQRVRQLITQRAKEFIGSLIKSTSALQVKIPPGLSTLQEELANICGTLLRLVSHNRAVFGEYYAQIISNHVKGIKTVEKYEFIVKPQQLFKE